MFEVQASQGSTARRNPQGLGLRIRGLKYLESGLWLDHTRVLQGL